MARKYTPIVLKQNHHYIQVHLTLTIHSVFPYSYLSLVSELLIQALLCTISADSLQHSTLLPEGSLIATFLVAK